MPFPRLALWGLLVSAPLASFAQTPTPTYRLYGGLGVYDGPGQTLLRLSNDRGIKIPVQATLGYQFRPRWAVQASFTHSSDKSSNGNSYDFTDSNASLIHSTNNGTFSQRNSTLSLLARYTLTRKPEHRLQVDLIGDFTGVHGTYRNISTYTYTNAQQSTTDTLRNDYSGTINNLYVSLGPSVRYRFGPRFEAVYDVLFNTSLTSEYHNMNTGMALGLRYRFGQF